MAGTSQNGSTHPAPGLSKRRPSLPSDSPTEVLHRVDSASPAKPPMALIKHGKYVLAGAVGCWWTGFVDAVVAVLDHERGWVRRVMVLALGLHGLTIAIFLYLVLYLPWFRGYIPNYPKWQQSARLRTLVPALTLTILLGWTSYVVSLSQAGKYSPLNALGDALKGVGNGDSALMGGHRGLGVFRSMAGATAVYTITFGVLGFIPAPSVRRRD